MSALREKLGSPELVERFITSFEQRVALRRKAEAAPSRANERAADCERRLANLTEALAKAGWSEALAAELREEEAVLGKLRSWLPAAFPGTGSIISSSAASIVKLRRLMVPWCLAV